MINDSLREYDSKNTKSDNEINDPLPPQMTDENDFRSRVFIEEITNTTFDERLDLVKKIKVSAQDHNFKVYLPNGEKINKNGEKKTSFFCNGLKSNKTCPFFIEFKTNALGKYIFKYDDKHNHSISTGFKSNMINTPIKEVIADLTGNFSSTKKLTEFLNKKYQIDTNYQQVYYHQTKLQREKWGETSEDTKNLLKFVKSENSKGLCKYDVLKSE